MQDDRAWLDALDDRLEDLSERWMRARWADLVHERAEALAPLQQQRAELLTDPQLDTRLARLLTADDPRTRRRADVLRRLSLQARVEGDRDIAALAEEIQSGHVVPFRPVLDGAETTRTAVIERLRLDPDRGRRREAALGLEPLAQRVAPLIRRLARARNERARALGFPDLPALRFHVDRVDRRWYDATMDEVERRGRAVWRARLDAMRAALGHEPAWHDLLYAGELLAGVKADDRLPRAAHPARAFALARAIGLDERMDAVQVRIEDIPYGGLEMPIAIPEDVRVLVNPPDGFGGLHTVVHELGHCAHARYNAQRGEALQRNEPGHFNEAVAEILGHVALRPEYLAREGFDRATAAGLIGAQVRRTVARANLAGAAVELALYADPDVPDGALDRMQREIMGVDGTPTWRLAPPAFLVEYPVYLHSYVIADLVAAQASASFTGRYGTAFDARVGRDLVEQVYAPGNSVDWHTKVERLTGAPLSVDAWVAELGAGTAL